MSQFSLITSAGLQTCLSATSNGILMDVRYFLLGMDHRIDPFQQSSFTVGPASAYDPDDITTVASESDTAPSAVEIIWNQIGYELSPTDNVYLSAGGEGTTGTDPLTINTGYTTTKKQAVNLFNGVPLSTIISGSNVTVPASADAGTWVITNPVGIEGVNTAPAADNSRFFTVVDYTAVQDDDGRLRGSFKCRVAADIGKVKFNRVYLYAVQLDGSYAEIGEPTLFAECILPEPVIKSNFAGGGSDDVIWDVQLDMQTVSASFSDIIYSTSGDYFQREPTGLTFPENLRLGYSLDNSDVGSKVFINTAYSSAVDEQALNHLTLQSSAIVNGVRFSRGTSFRKVYGGATTSDLVISADVDGTSAVAVIRPVTDGGLQFGNPSIRANAWLLNANITNLTATNIQGIANDTSIGAANISGTLVSATYAKITSAALGEDPSLYLSQGTGTGTLGSKQRLLSLEMISRYQRTTGTSAINTWIKPVDALSAYGLPTSVQHNTYLGAVDRPFSQAYIANVSATNIVAVAATVSSTMQAETLRLTSKAHLNGRTPALGQWIAISTSSLDNLTNDEIYVYAYSTVGGPNAPIAVTINAAEIQACLIGETVLLSVYLDVTPTAAAQGIILKPNGALAEVDLMYQIAPETPTYERCVGNGRILRNAVITPVFAYTSVTYPGLILFRDSALAFEADTNRVHITAQLSYSTGIQT